MTKKPLAISLGDPAGIGAEATIRALDNLSRSLPVWLFGHWDYALNGAGSGAIGFDMPRYASFDDAAAAGVSRAFIEVASGGGALEIGKVREEYGRVALLSIEAAADAVVAGHCSALVTAPIHKQALLAAGSRFAGHTELLADRAGLARYGRDYAMMFDSPSLRVVLATVHVALKDVADLVNAELVADICRLTRREVSRFIGREPKIAVAGLNPHAGEGGAFGSEESAIARGIELARADGCEVTGPSPADTLFWEAAKGRHDVVVAMYHDQGLTPVKTLHFDSSVNVTLGLPYLRVSVDHGTAFDIAGKGMADWRPMKYAIEWAIRHAERLPA
jgi:4-hydroxythreonine-4-phosphate dehydrogenase